MDRLVVRGRRRVRLLVLGTVLAAVAAGCGSSVPADEVTSTIVGQLKRQGVTVDDDAVTCPGDLEELPAEVGRTVRCGFTAGGQPADAVARVSSVDGDTVNLEITTEARPVPRELLERTVAAEITRAGIGLESVACAGELEPEVGRTQTCTTVAAGQERTLTTRVTEVRGGLVNFSIEQS